MYPIDAFEILVSNLQVMMRLLNYKQVYSMDNQAPRTN